MPLDPVLEPGTSRQAYYASLARVAELQRRLDLVVAILEPHHDSNDPTDISAAATALRAAKGHA